MALIFNRLLRTPNSERLALRRITRTLPSRAALPSQRHGSGNAYCIGRIMGKESDVPELLAEIDEALLPEVQQRAQSYLHSCVWPRAWRFYSGTGRGTEEK